VSRITTIALGVVAVLLGIAFEKQNIAFMVSLAFAVAASANFPVLFYLGLERPMLRVLSSRPRKSDGAAVQHPSTT
jgi:hypothetical protein